MFISSKQHRSHFNLTLLDVVDALGPAAPPLDPPLGSVLQHGNAPGGFGLLKLDLRRGGESSHLHDGRSWWDLWENAEKKDCPLKPNGRDDAAFWVQIARDVGAVLTNLTKMDPLKPVRMATLAVNWWVIRLPTLLLCYGRIWFPHFDALNEKPHCDQPYAALWEDSAPCS